MKPADIIIDLLNANWMHRAAIVLGDQDTLDVSIEDYEAASRAALAYLRDSMPDVEVNKRIVWIPRGEE